MDGELYKAAIEGNTQLLFNLIETDGLILDRTNSITAHLETPLHIAAMRGHQRFVSELLKLKPGLASELDFRQSSPLHIASLKGHAGIVRELVRTNPDMCLARDRDGRNPVHLAAMMGKIDALKELVRAKPEAARATVGGGGTVLHLCVEYSQLEALKVLVDTIDFRDLVNSRDQIGNTVLHVSVVHKQVEMTKFLLSAIAGIQVNALNLSGMTAMDILIQRRMDTRDAEIEETLNQAGAVGKREILLNPPAFSHAGRNNWNRATSEYPSLKSLFSSKEFQKLIKRKDDDWLDKKRNAMMVVATVIASMVFQVGVNPPKEVWKSVDKDNPGGAWYYLTFIFFLLQKYGPFYVVNTVCFVTALTIIFLLVSELPLNKIGMWFLTVMTWVAITALALTYTVSLYLLTPKENRESTKPVIGMIVSVWIWVMILVLAGNTIRLLIWLKRRKHQNRVV